jgi:hypothetical protein
MEAAFNRAKKRMLSNSPSSFFYVIQMAILQSANPSVENGWLFQGEDNIHYCNGQADLSTLVQSAS